jgi:signal peptidase II
VEVFKWFKILFIENEGMAWGTEIPGTTVNISNAI